MPSCQVLSHIFLLVSMMLFFLLFEVSWCSVSPKRRQQLVHHFPFMLSFPRKPHYKWDHKISHVSSVFEWVQGLGFRVCLNGRMRVDELSNMVSEKYFLNVLNRMIMSSCIFLSNSCEQTEVYKACNSSRCKLRLDNRKLQFIVLVASILVESHTAHQVRILNVQYKIIFIDLKIESL